jgi:diguanylate cyclase (GGDEF)-like protein/PAS domain S-box-containing protein
VPTAALAPRQLRWPSEHDLLEKMPDGVLVCDAGGRIVFANRWAGRLTGYSRQELLGHPIELLVPGRYRASHRAHRRGYIAAHTGPRSMGDAEHDFRVRRKDGTEFSADIALGPIRALGGPQTVVVVRDITERRNLETALEHQALHDPLTGLANRTLFFDRLNQAIFSGRRDRRRVALVMLDVDGFKAVNDAYGHATGDELLKAMAARLRRGLRATDTAARLGGDEFALILPRIAGREAAERLVGKQMRALRASYSVRPRPIRIGVSGGAALFPDDGDDADKLMRHADAAMYSAKRRGGGLAFFLTQSR